MSSLKKKKFTMPQTLTIIFLLIVLMAILTWIVPSGNFERVDIDGRSVVVAGTYEKAPSNPQGITDVFTAPINGFIDAAEVVGFVLIVGGAFGIVNKTGAIEAVIAHTVNKMKKFQFLIIPISMILFGLGGTTFGMSEETLPFYMIFIPLMTSMGYDSLTAVATVFIGATAGFGAATTNPFSVGIAQALSQIVPGSGIEFRVVMFIIYMAISIGFVMMYANKVKKDPKKSLVHDISLNQELMVNSDTNIKEFTKREAMVIAIFTIGMAIMIYGVLRLEWYITEIAMIFTAIGIISGIASGLKQDEIVNSFISGAGDLITAGLCIAFARGIVIIAENGFIIDTILNSAANLLNGLPKTIFINLTFLIEGLIAFLIPSASGLASLTIPVLAPLGDLVDVSRQMIVTAYQFGIGVTNLITPTSGVLMGALAVANIPWSKWVRFVIPLMVVLTILVMAFLTIGLYRGF
ncbi:TPA: YfcC family protein [Clostridioides difficile]|uniref:YfcC family protein n=1 Tax=Clostridioides difficile TaxID=1496 RepID=UPI00097FE14F|nr:YfcC family protein [Clostridioides difficile]SJO72487.1 Putative p-aminobenzoyl-glutamate transporter [Clostridioides difficile]HBE8643623.1 YfcC family protein [Clostridioides difficile]HBF2151889.1 YfcC family protein [Clostridioides difficile]HBF4823835.1 YfcC family protein [Clostridioides difficile]HBF7334764.1 YfcC family protein [Clostridioides difficile]